MEEEPGENELEERMYAMLHYGDDTQTDVDLNTKNSVPNFDNVPKSTLRRYWRTNENQNTPYNKINTPNKIDTSRLLQSKKNTTDERGIKPKDEKNSPSPVLAIFQEPVSENFKKTILILENDDDSRVVELESSEEDEVIEVALPPKPTITIESSDEDEIQITSKSLIENVDKLANRTSDNQAKNASGSTSPVPSIVSSTSDDFIRGDCLALNITSQSSNNQSIELNLHASDIEQTPSKKRRKKKNKDAASTPLQTVANKTQNPIDVCFVTPKSKAKNNKQKSYRVLDTIIPNPDVYDSDSNQSLIESVKNQHTYSVTDKSLPNTDVYETDSNNSDRQLKTGNSLLSDIDSAEHSATETDSVEKTLNTTNENAPIVDLTDKEIDIDENIVMGNVTGFPTVDITQEEPQSVNSKCGSTRIPSILYDDLDFDNFKGSNVSCRRRYSLSKLRAEMDKFYNESWGGEDFNHREILKNMSRDKNLWAIDPKDRMPALAKRRVTCQYCNRVGHRDDVCRMKPPVCYMCGSTGHCEPRCPKKLCVNCGTPNRVFTNICYNCSKWHLLRCGECGQNGHPASHCPDVWRRYHYTIDIDTQLEENRQTKKHYQLFCSGCGRRGHLVHTCRVSLPFSGLPIFSPYVSLYRPVYDRMNTNFKNSSNQQNKQQKHKNSQQDETVSSALPPRHDGIKRQSKSPCANEVAAKKKYLGPQESTEPKNYVINPQKKNTPKEKNRNLDSVDTTDKNKSANKTVDVSIINKAPDFIPVQSNNHDKKGQIIQDNEVSDTSEVITSARVYITNNISESLKTAEGESWLKEVSKKNNIEIESSDSNLYLSIKGTVGNQEAFQTELREWIKKSLDHTDNRNSETEVNLSKAENKTSTSNNIPKNKNKVLRKINEALESLNADLGDPNALYKELIFLQNKHKQLLKQKVVNPQQLTNNRNNIKRMLKNLNIVLLGQAGLANGSVHLNELHLLQEKLVNLRQRTIPIPLRKEIGEHFHFIFTAIPRNDYVELLNKYYGNKQLQSLKLKTKSPKKNVDVKNAKGSAPAEALTSKKATKRLEKVKKTKNKLILCHNRISHVNPVGSSLVQTKNELERELLVGITFLHKKTSIGKKVNKKMIRIQKQAEKFLTNL